MQEINLVLTIEEVNALLNVLGELPTKTGAWNLVVKIKQQAEVQVEKPTETAKEE
jgi:hypothetical protein